MRSNSKLFKNKGPTAESNNSDEEDSGELKMTTADTRETPTAYKEKTPGAASSTSLVDATVQTVAQQPAKNNATTSVEQIEDIQHNRQTASETAEKRRPQTPA